MTFRKNDGGHGRYGSFRPTQTRKPLPIVVVVCDDTKTAVAYFTELKREVKARVTVDVVRAPYSGANAEDVIKHAYGLKKSRVPAQINDSVWTLIDLEGELKKQAQAKKAKKHAVGKGVRVALSHPCFEVWTLAHLVDTGEAFIDCGAVITRLKLEWKKAFKVDFGRKGQADYSKLMPYRDKAVQRAKGRSAKGDQSWTEVFMVVEAIMLLNSDIEQAGQRIARI